jgi:hypothetical protein
LVLMMQSLHQGDGGVPVARQATDGPGVKGEKKLV